MDKTQNPAPTPRFNPLVRSQFLFFLFVSTQFPFDLSDYQRPVREGLHRCHVQEAEGNGERPCLCGDCAWHPVHVSYGTGSQQGTPGTLAPPGTLCNVAKCPLQWPAVGHGPGQCSPVSRETLGAAAGTKSNCVTNLSAPQTRFWLGAVLFL